MSKQQKMWAIRSPWGHFTKVDFYPAGLVRSMSLSWKGKSYDRRSAWWKAREREGWSCVPVLVTLDEDQEIKT